MARNPGPGSLPRSQKRPSQSLGGNRGLWEVGATATTRTHRALLGYSERFLESGMACDSVCAGAPEKTLFQYGATESSITSQDW